MNVELGAGERVEPGYLAVDLNPRRADVIADALHLPFGDATVDSMRAVDVLEHLSYRDTDAALAEWARVMKPHGTLFVQVPDTGEIIRRYVGALARENVAGVQDPLLAQESGLGTPDDLPDTLLAGITWRLLGGHADGHYVDADGDWRWNAHYALFTGASLRAAVVAAGFVVASIITNRHPNLLCKAVRA